MGIIDYHIKELKIATNRDDVRNILPEILDNDKFILDIGCGIGQSFLALGCTDRICIGIDVNEEVINYGIENYGHLIHYIQADAKCIPLPSNTFNLVFSRVSLPYTNLPKVIREIYRVLQNGGRIWMTLHHRAMAIDYLKKAWNARNMRRMIHGIYILVNGYLLKYLGFVMPFVNGKYESWQDIASITKRLCKAGFNVKIQKIGRHTVIEGTLRKSETPVE